MSFLHPEYLYYLLPLVFVGFIVLLLKKEAQYSYFSQEIMNKLRVNANALTMKKRNLLFLFVFTCMVIAFAEPIIKDGTVEVKSKSADIMLALDISDSMLAEDLYPNRLKFAKEKALELLKQAPEERIGVVGFAKNSYLVSPMSFDHDAVAFLLRQLNTDSITEKGTDFMSLLDVVNNTIKTDSKKYLLVLSDGGDKEDFTQEIAYAKENNIVVFIFGIGTTKGAPIKKKDGSFIKYKGEIIVSKLNENISDFATGTGGVYIESVKSVEDITRMLQEIDNISEQKDLKSETINKFIPLFYYPLGLAVLLLLFAVSSLYKKPVATLAILALFLQVQEAEAGMLDFLYLQKAKEAYENGDFESADSLYSKYATQNNDANAFYNQGNALYKQEKYDEAISAYKKAEFNDDVKKANTLANVGNAQVKKATLEEAVKSYEESLKLHDDEKVRENLVNVKKEIEKQKKKEEEQKKQDEKNQDEENQDKNDQNKEEQDKQNSDQKNKDDNKEQENDKEQENKDKEDKEKSDEEKQNSNKDDVDKQNQQKQNKQDEKKENDEEEKAEEKDQKKEDLKKLEEEKEKNEALNAVSQADEKDKMSDAEERKWLQQLNDQQSTFMYMLNNKSEENLDEKPW